jgi:hypothetical protein
MFFESSICHVIGGRRAQRVRIPVSSRCPRRIERSQRLIPCPQSPTRHQDDDRVGGELPAAMPIAPRAARSRPLLRCHNRHRHGSDRDSAPGFHPTDARSAKVLIFRDPNTFALGAGHTTDSDRDVEPGSDAITPRTDEKRIERSQPSIRGRLQTSKPTRIGKYPGATSNLRSQGVENCKAWQGTLQETHESRSVAAQDSPESCA